MKIAIVIPTHKEILSEMETKNIDHCVKVFPNLDKYIVTPRAGIDMTYYEKNWGEYIRALPFAPWEGTFDSYQTMCLSADFYSMFSEYDYILIHHTDAVVFGTEQDLFEYAEAGYDYYGAPLTALNPVGIAVSRHSFPAREIDFVKKHLGLMKPLIVGNGGFTLRKIDSTVRLLKKYDKKIQRWFPAVYDDIVLSWLAQYDMDYQACPVEMATRFSVDCVFDEKLVGQLFAVHGKFVLDREFWERHEGLYPDT